MRSRLCVETRATLRTLPRTVMPETLRVHKLVEFYVGEHNSRLPHSAFRGQAPDEMYFGTGDDVPEHLLASIQIARRRRLEVNRAARCAVCA